MASNQYITFYNANNEQSLIENLVVEAIKFHAHDILYLPRTGVNEDAIFNEYEFSKFQENYPIEIYIENVGSYEGQGDFLSKFGLEIRHEMTVQMSIRSFESFVKPGTTFARPREGDLLYFPMLNAAYEITDVIRSAVFYQLGKLYSYKLQCKLFEYSNENFNTGNTEVDNIYASFDFLTNTDAVPMADNTEVQDEANSVLDWDSTTPFGKF